MFPRLCLSLIAPVSAAIWHWAEQRVPGHRDWTDVEVSPDGQTICAVTGAGDLISSYDGGETWYKWTDDFYRFNADTWTITGWGVVTFFIFQIVGIIIPIE